MAEKEENWLDGLCHYNGTGADLPLGGYAKIPNWQPEKIVQKWMVLDAEVDDGFVWKKTNELSPDDILIGVQMNQSSIQAIVDTYGKDFYQVREANGGPLMSLDRWQEKFHNNGLGLVALRNIRTKLDGSAKPVYKI